MTKSPVNNSAVRRPIIAVIGGSSCTPATYQIAKTVGRTLAEQGAVVICGGLGGVMEAVAEGASLAGGEVIGILPGVEKNEANEFISLVIPTGMHEARNTIIINSAEAVIALDGEYGTMSEIAFALRAGKPIFSLGDWNLDRSIIAVDDPEKAALLAVRAATDQKEQPE